MHLLRPVCVYVINSLFPQKVVDPVAVVTPKIDQALQSFKQRAALVSTDTSDSAPSTSRETARESEGSKEQKVGTHSSFCIEISDMARHKPLCC